MRNNCIGLVDLLCAYADGELAESDIKIVENHLEICENCSAILKVYSEITNSITETNVSAPDALCIGVMNRIQSESVPQKIVKEKKWWHRQVILKRYAPIAACLVVGLLVWGIWGNFRALLPASSPMLDSLSAAPEATMVNEAMSVDDADFAYDSGGAVVFEGEANGLAPAPSADAPEAASTEDPVNRRSQALEGLQIGKPIEQTFTEQLITLAIDESSLTPTGSKYSITNGSDENIEFIEQFSIQVLVDEIWYEIIKNEGGAYTDSLGFCEPGNEISLGVDWSYFYGHLPEGTFRLVKSIKYSDSDKPAFYIAGEFIIN